MNTMPAKRPAIPSESSGPRQMKQAKLNFGSFSGASRRLPKSPDTAAERDDHQESLITVSARSVPDTARRQPTDLSRPETLQPETLMSSKHSQRDSSSSSTSTTAETPLQAASECPATDAPLPIPGPALTPFPPSSQNRIRIRITERTGDIFAAAPPNTLLIHACNASGSWGAGIALAFRARYPAAFAAYRAHCAAAPRPDQLLGTALLIPPRRSPPPLSSSRSESSQGQGRGKRHGHCIGCLFTSRRSGKARDPPDRIVRATGPAMRHLLRLVAEEERRSGVRIGEVRMCQINSGLFAVPWERSKRAVEELDLGEEEVPGGTEGGVVEVVVYGL